MDHVDWLCEKQAREVAQALGQQVRGHLHGERAGPAAAGAVCSPGRGAVLRLGDILKTLAEGAALRRCCAARYNQAWAIMSAVQVVEGGRVIWRSASLAPPYAKYIQEAGFEVGRRRLAVGTCAQPMMSLTSDLLFVRRARKAAFNPPNSAAGPIGW